MVPCFWTSWSDFDRLAASVEEPSVRALDKATAEAGPDAASSGVKPTFVRISSVGAFLRSVGRLFKSEKKPPGFSETGVEAPDEVGVVSLLRFLRTPVGLRRSFGCQWVGLRLSVPPPPGNLLLSGASSDCSAAKTSAGISGLVPESSA